MSGITNDAIVADLQCFMKQYGSGLDRTHRISVGITTNIVVHTLGVTTDCDTDIINKRRLKQEIFAYIRDAASERDDDGDIPLLTGNNMHITFLPDVLTKFAGLGNFGSGHLQSILNAIIPRSKEGGRRGSTARIQDAPEGIIVPAHQYSTLTKEMLIRALESRDVDIAALQHDVAIANPIALPCNTAITLTSCGRPALPMGGGRSHRRGRKHRHGETHISLCVSS